VNAITRDGGPFHGASGGRLGGRRRSASVRRWRSVFLAFSSSRPLVDRERSRHPLGCRLLSNSCLGCPGSAGRRLLSLSNGGRAGRFGQARLYVARSAANHFEMTEFLDGDVLKHVPDVDIFDVKRLHPILQLSYFRCKDSSTSTRIISDARGSIQLAASTWNHFPTKRNHLRVQLLDAITTQIEETSQ
jgi:hypothetical protein